MKLKEKKAMLDADFRNKLSSQNYDNFEIQILLKVNYSTIWRWRKNKILKYSKIGGKYYYPKAVIDRLLRERDD